MPEPMSEVRLAEIEAEHVPDAQMQAISGSLWCSSEDCHQDDVTGAIHVDWPCDAAQLIAEVRRLQRHVAARSYSGQMTARYQSPSGRPF